jgi:SseB protein N-terminal domain
VEEEASEPNDLTGLVQAARQGLRSNVRALMSALDTAELLIPLAQEIAGAPEGERIEPETELRIIPHLLEDADGSHFAALFTRAELLAELAQKLGWTTGEDELKFCTISARVALDMALEIIDDRQILGLILNPGSESELLLRREELASLSAGHAIPLVGYVQGVADGDDPQTLVAEPGEPPPAELTQALESCLSSIPEVSAYALSRTFNPERDLEPHATLRLATSAEEAALQAIANRVIAAIGEHVPPPGYVDIVFDRPSEAG